VRYRIEKPEVLVVIFILESNTIGRSRNRNEACTWEFFAWIKFEDEITMTLAFITLAFYSEFQTPIAVRLGFIAFHVS
jgi:hypothetical protein